MTAADVGVIVTQGAGQIAASAPLAGVWAALVIGTVLLMLGCGRFARALWLDPPCPCCTGRPLEHPDCTCRQPCGWQHCPALDAEEPMFFESGHVIGRDGREMILRRARAEDQAEAQADGITEVLGQWEREWREQKGEGRG